MLAQHFSVCTIMRTLLYQLFETSAPVLLTVVVTYTGIYTDNLLLSPSCGTIRKSPSLLTMQDCCIALLKLYTWIA